MEVSVGQRNNLCCIEHVASRRQAGRATDARYLWYSGTVGDDMLLGFAEPADFAVIESELADIELGEIVTVCILSMHTMLKEYRRRSVSCVCLCACVHACVCACVVCALSVRRLRVCGRMCGRVCACVNVRFARTMSRSGSVYVCVSAVYEPALTRYDALLCIFRTRLSPGLCLRGGLRMRSPLTAQRITRTSAVRASAASARCTVALNTIRPCGMMFRFGMMSCACKGKPLSLCTRLLGYCAASAWHP